MTGFWVLIKKELLEQRRTWNFIGVTVFFAAVAALIVMIPFIITLFNNQDRDAGYAEGLLLAYGFTIAFLGTIISIIIGMGALANERASGTAGMVLSKPVSRAAFVCARFIGTGLSVYLGLILGSVVMYLLTLILINYYDPVRFLIFMGITGVYFLYISSIAFFWSGMFSRQLLAGGVTLVLYIIQVPLSQIPHTQAYWPINTVEWAQNVSGITTDGARLNTGWESFPVALGCIALFTAGAWAAFRKKEL